MIKHFALPLSLLIFGLSTPVFASPVQVSYGEQWIKRQLESMEKWIKMIEEAEQTVNSVDDLRDNDAYNSAYRPDRFWKSNRSDLEKHPRYREMILRADQMIKRRSLVEKGIPLEAFPVSETAMPFWDAVWKKLQKVYNPEELASLVEYLKSDSIEKNPEYKAQRDLFLQHKLPKLTRKYQEKFIVKAQEDYAFILRNVGEKNWDVARAGSMALERTLKTLKDLKAPLDQIEVSIVNPADELDKQTLTLAAIEKKSLELRKQSEAELKQKLNKNKAEYQAQVDRFLKSLGKVSPDQKTMVKEHGIPDKLLSGPSGGKIWIYYFHDSHNILMRKELHMSAAGKLLTIKQYID